MTMRFLLTLGLLMALTAPAQAEPEPTPTPRPLPIRGVSVDVKNREINGRAHIERPPFAMHRSLRGAQQRKGPHGPKPTFTPTPKP
jgi:hypothetical protein